MSAVSCDYTLKCMFHLLVSVCKGKLKCLGKYCLKISSKMKLVIKGDKSHSFRIDDTSKLL